jgi:hypothetical protein
MDLTSSIRVLITISSIFLIGSSGYSTSSCCNGAQTFSGLNYPVDNQAVAVTVQDNCLLTTLTSSTATLTVTGPGTYTWSISGGNAASGSITVDMVDKAFHILH